MTQIPEIDLDQLDADLYEAWQQLQKRNYGSAQNLVAKSWRHVREFNLSLDEHTEDPDRPVYVHHTIYTGLVPAAKRLFYHFLNRRVNCGYECAWVYPYGWVPEAGCPEHDADA